MASKGGARKAWDRRVMFYIHINLYPVGDGYGIDMDTNIQDEDTIQKVLKDTVDAWDKRIVDDFSDTLDDEDIW